MEGNICIVRCCSEGGEAAPIDFENHSNGLMGRNSPPESSEERMGSEKESAVNLGHFSEDF